MSLKFLAKSAVLMVFLLSAGIFLRNMASAEAPISVSLSSNGTTTAQSFILGEPIVLNGSVDFYTTDVSSAQVALTINGPVPVTQALPAVDGLYTYASKYLTVKVTSTTTTFSNGGTVGSTLGTSGSTLGTTGSTLGTLGSGTSCECTRVYYEITFTPPMLIDPAPDFTLVPLIADGFALPVVTPTAIVGAEGVPTLPDATAAFSVPLVGTPLAGEPNAVPSANLAFAIPTVETPTPAPDAADPLPTVTSGFAIAMPSTPTVLAGAPPELENNSTLVSAFSIPLPPTPTSETGVYYDLPTSTKVFDIPVATLPAAEVGAATALPSPDLAFAIPQGATPTAVAGAATLGASPDATDLFTVPNSKTPRGLHAIDDDTFLVVVNNSGGDLIYKLDQTSRNE